MINLINGDCLDYLNDVPNVDLVVTSPPYFNVKEYSHYQSYEKYLNFLKDAFSKIFDKLNDGRMCCVNISPIIIPRKKRQDESKRLALPFHFVNLMEDIGFKFLEDIIWIKPNASVPNRNGGFYRHRKPVAYKPNCVTEYVFVFQKPCDCLIDKIIHSYSDDIVNQSKIMEEYEKTNVWFFNPESKIDHPAPFPLVLPHSLIKYYSFVEDVVLDPFMGSGTTGVACKELNRNFIGIEKEKKYYSIACERINTSQIKLDRFWNEYD